MTSNCRYPSPGPDAHRTIQLVKGLVVQLHTLSEFDCQVKVFLRLTRGG